MAVVFDFVFVRTERKDAQMKNNCKKSIRPFSGISVAIIFLIVILLSGLCVSVVYSVDGSLVMTVLCAVLCGAGALWLILSKLPYVLFQKVKISNETVTVDFLTKSSGKTGLPAHRKAAVSTKEIAMFGVFYASDIIRFTKHHNGLLAEEWAKAFHFNTVIKIDTSICSNDEQNFLVIAEKNGTFTVTELKTYSLGQVKELLMMISRETGITPLGRISCEEKKKETGRALNIVLGILSVLSLATFVFLMFLDSKISPNHDMAKYNSGYKIGYIVFSIAWGASCLALNELRKIKDPEKHSFYRMIIVPPFFISLVAWIACFILNIFF